MTKLDEYRMTGGFLFLLLVLIYTPWLRAGTVVAIRGNQVRIQFEGESVNTGDQMILVEPGTGKNKAIIRIDKVAAKQAAGTVLRGRAENGYTTKPYAATAGAGRADSTPAAGSNNAGKTSGKSLGVLFSYMMDSMTVSPTATMTGTGMGLLGYYDFPVSPSFQIRGSGGVEQFNVAQASYKVNILYLSMYGTAKYYLKKRLNPHSWGIWGGLTLGYLLPVSKSTTILDSARISGIQIYGANLGLDIPLSGNAYMPVSLDYGVFPSSGEITANILYLRVGYGKTF